MWPIPFWQPPMSGQGYYFPKLPTPTPQEIGLMQRDGHISKKTATYDVRDQFNSDMDAYIAKARNKYSGY